MACPSASGAPAAVADVPVLVNAPMARIAGGALAAAVTRDGWLGFIGGGYGDVAWIDEQLAIAGDVPVGVGLITWALTDRRRTAARRPVRDQSLPRTRTSSGTVPLGVSAASAGGSDVDVDADGAERGHGACVGGVIGEDGGDVSPVEDAVRGDGADLLR